MSADISYEETVIRNEEDGEKVRDAIVESMKKIDSLNPSNVVGISDDFIHSICVR